LKRIRFRQKQFQKKPAQDIYPVNEKIRVPELRVIDENEEMIGVMDTQKALAMAKERELDLVCISPKAQPPVARFLDYGSFKYQKDKQQKKQKVKKTDTKEIRLSPRIGQHDLEVRLKKAEEFLNKGHKIIVEIILKGRERKFPDVAKQVIEDFIKSLKNTFEIQIEQEPKKQGNKIIAIVYSKGKIKPVEEKAETDSPADNNEEKNDTEKSNETAGDNQENPLGNLD